MYESCNNQTNDAIDAYTRALELDPNNAQIKQRLNALKQNQNSGGSNNQQNPANQSVGTLPSAQQLQRISPTGVSNLERIPQVSVTLPSSTKQDAPTKENPKIPSLEA